jgi:hypothetical protein
MLAVLLGVGTATAQPLPRAEDKAEADRLFEEGRALLEQGDRAEACKRFELSIRKDPRAVGTMLNLGLCHEEVGQVATAVRYYQEARDRAHDQALKEHQDAADRKLALLAPRVPHLAIALPPGAPDRTKILVDDDMVIALDAAGDVTLDPGPHAVVVTAPGKLPFEGKVTLEEGQHATLTVPPLQGAKTVVIRETGSRRALVGKILVASGGAALLGGIGLAYYGRSQYWDQFPDGAMSGVVAPDPDHDCWTALDNDSKIVRQCNQRGHDATASAARLSKIGIGTAIAGGLIAVGGAILWFTAPAPAETPVVTFDVHPGGGSFAFTRAF